VAPEIRFNVRFRTGPLKKNRRFAGGWVGFVTFVWVRSELSPAGGV
jgi:hypothetical protein